MFSLLPSAPQGEVGMLWGVDVQGVREIAVLKSPGGKCFSVERGLGS